MAVSPTKICLIFVLFYFITLVHCKENRIDVNNFPIIRSTSIDSGDVKNETLLNNLINMNLNFLRVYITQADVESQLTNVNTSLTVEYLRSTVDEWLEPYSKTLKFSFYDQMITDLVENNISPIIEIGEGTNWSLAKLPDGSLADPGNLGTSAYLAYQYRYSRAVVHRYKKYCPMFQIENELNEAYLEALSGIRSPRTLKTPWGDWDWLTELLSTLRLAVKDEDETLLVTQNVHTDIPEHIHQVLHLKGFYLDAVKDWDPILDVISFDGYPNYIVATPNYGSDIGNRTANIISVLSDKTKPVFCAETGYPTANNPMNQVYDIFNYTQQRQSDYFETVFDSILDNGGYGLQVFKTTPSNGVYPPPGGYTREDKKAAEKAEQMELSGNIFPSGIFFLTHLNYTLTHFNDVIAGSGNGWGIIDSEGNPMKSYYTLQKIYGKYSDLL